MGLTDDQLVRPQEVSEALRCPICIDVLEDPVFWAGRPCTHVFCRSCITVSLRKVPLCPLCRHDMAVGNMQEHKELAAQVGELAVHCLHECGWSGTYSSLATHLQVCSKACTTRSQRSRGTTSPRPRSAKMTPRRRA
eukprot:NODE_2896_length_857_cov_358.074813.p1 GENE.NODE_2896_length_857_cov_358.074813~~NODE_2896_length_857_cov_358.074813.p1  ORF type:complete len:159 (-),score=21.69 NODE_2896_length_857_cov_358.074813:365-775(-)